MAIIDVIKYEGGNNVLVWKHPREDFNTSAQLIVHESQEAILFKDGQMIGSYTAGKHTIETENIPGIRRWVGLVTGGVSPNHYEVYFVNKAYSMDIPWGTRTPWTIQDQSLQIPFEMQAHGSFAVKVIDSKQILLKLVGTTTSFSQRALQDYFYSIMISKIKDCISNIIFSEGLSHTEISSRLSNISNKVKPQLSDSLNNYGLSLEEFTVESISILKDEVYADVRKAMGTRAIDIITGVSEQEKMGYDVAKTQAQNPGMGGQMGQVFTGIAAGAAAAPTIGGIVRNVVQPVSTGKSEEQRVNQFSMGTVKKQKVSSDEPEEMKCPHCGSPLNPNSKFCNQCGKPIEQNETEKITCPVCGESLSENSKFCNYCGTKL